jgi:hypothetical protein
MVPFGETLDPNKYLNQLFQIMDPGVSEEKMKIIHRQTDTLKKEYDRGGFNYKVPLIVEEIGTIETTDKMARRHLKSFWEQQIKEKERSKQLKHDGSFTGSYSMPNSVTNKNSFTTN